MNDIIKGRKNANSTDVLYHVLLFHFVVLGNLVHCNNNNSSSFAKFFNRWTSWVIALIPKFICILADRSVISFCTRLVYMVFRMQKLFIIISTFCGILVILFMSCFFYLIFLPWAPICRAICMN